MWRRANSVRGIEYGGLLEVFLTVYTAWSIGIRGPELDTEEGKFVVAFLSRGPGSTRHEIRRDKQDKPWPPPFLPVYFTITSSRSSDRNSDAGSPAPLTRFASTGL